MKIKIDLSNLEKCLPQNISAQKKDQFKTLFYSKMALLMHEMYKGKITSFPKAAFWGPAWLNIWYTPGVSAPTLAIKKQEEKAYTLTNRANKVAIISDGSRVLGLGNCGPKSALAVMEGKALLMNRLGAIDAEPLCINSLNEKGLNDPQKIIDFAHMISPSYSAINLEDISQPNCYKVLDTLKETYPIPVWHDDAQGTACITCAALINALKVAGKKIDKVKIILFGAGAANTSIAAFLLTLGADPKKMILFDSKGPLHKNRTDLKNNPAYYKQWGLCQKTNFKQINSKEEAFKEADVLIAFSRPGPDIIAPELRKLMAKRAIVFACANPVPEIYPEQAIEAGAFIVGTGRGDFENQINNSLCFPGILKGVLLCGAKKITDTMALAAAKAIAKRAQDTTLNRHHILPDKTDLEIYPLQAAAVAAQAKKEGLATIKITPKQVYTQVKEELLFREEINNLLIKNKLIKKPTQKLVQAVFEQTLKEVL